MKQLRNKAVEQETLSSPLRMVTRHVTLAPTDAFSQFRCRAWQVAAACMLSLSSPSGLAQGKADMRDLLDMDLEALMQMPITGSHIRRTDAAGFDAISVIDRDAIQRSGATSIELLLQRMPESAGFAGNQSNAYWGAGNGNGSTHVNLRGLGVNRTLVLLNGRRLANGGIGANAAVDLNIIPLAMVERIEILNDGASAIYGADAVAGVVNIITRNGLDGGEIGLRYGESFRHDGSDRALDLAWGKTGPRGSIMLGASHSGNSAAGMAERAPCALGESGGQLLCANSGNTIGGRALLADGQRVNFNQVLGGNGNFYEPYSATKHNFNSNLYLNAVNPIDRTTLSGFGTLKLDDGLTVFAELIYNERRSHQLATPGTLGLNRAINIAATQPTNPTGQDLLLQRRRLQEGGTRDLYENINSFALATGLQGRLGALGSLWDWSMALTWRRNTSRDGSTNVANLDRVDQTLNTAVCSNAPGAAIPCADYLGYGDVTKAVLDYITLTTRNAGGNEQKGVSASITGQPFSLPAGPVKLAAGVEVRSDRGWRDPDPLMVVGIANDNRQDSVSGSYTAREAFTEAVLPLFSERPWSKSLVLNSAVRYSTYDQFGQATTYKLGLDWQPVTPLRLHANYATAFRAPNVPELYAGASKLNLITADPCSGWSALSPSSVVYQNCKAAGLPVGYQQLVTSILTTVGGNRNLKPEEADTMTVGAVWEPVSDLHLAVDFFKLTIDNAIGGVNGSETLAACYNSPGRTHPFCSSAYFTRNPASGDIDFLSTRQVNESSERMAGVDFALHYRFSVAQWNAKLNWQLSNLRKYDLLAYPGAQEVHLAGKVTTGRGSYAHWRSFGTLVLERGPWSGAYSVQYIGAADDISAPPGTIGAHVPSVVYHNLQLQYVVDKSLRFAGGVDNLFNRAPPFVRGWLDVNTDTMTYDVLGRRWYVSAMYSW